MVFSGCLVPVIPSIASISSGTVNRNRNTTRARYDTDAGVRNINRHEATV